MNQKIAILTDSGSDVPPTLVEAYHIFVAPLQVIYKAKTYRDGLEISPQEVYQNLDKEVPTTSLPIGEDVSALFKKIKEEGYTHILAVVLSSGLSGTYNLLNVLKQECPLPLEIIDTKNIGIGSGLSVIQAAKLVKQGLTFSAILEEMPKVLKNTKVFFVLNTLKYLELGGRIGKVSAMLGYVLDLKPIITCNEEGIYVTVAKARGRRLSLNQCMAQADAFIKGAQKVSISIAQGDALKEATEIQTKYQALYPNTQVSIGPISPALGVHTGPGLIAVAVQIND